MYMVCVCVFSTVLVLAEQEPILWLTVCCSRLRIKAPSMCWVSLNTYAHRGTTWFKLRLVSAVCTLHFTPTHPHTYHTHFLWHFDTFWHISWILSLFPLCFCFFLGFFLFVCFWFVFFLVTHGFRSSMSSFMMPCWRPYWGRRQRFCPASCTVMSTAFWSLAGAAKPGSRNSSRSGHALGLLILTDSPLSYIYLDRPAITLCWKS